MNSVLVIPRFLKGLLAAICSENVEFSGTQKSGHVFQNAFFIVNDEDSFLVGYRVERLFQGPPLLCSQQRVVGQFVKKIALGGGEHIYYTAFARSGLTASSSFRRKKCGRRQTVRASENYAFSARPFPGFSHRSRAAFLARAGRSAGVMFLTDTWPPRALPMKLK